MYIYDCNLRYRFLQSSHHCIRVAYNNAYMGVGNGGREGQCPPWIFIHDTNVVDTAVNFFFGLFFRYPPPHPKNFSADALECLSYFI